ncbi:DUF1565 domain-containing protein [Desertifilum sp. FACHB-1129]|uniref:DUF1565 domain-containing protein n=1 Tax=Desertifilum TaxID=1185872 RepID=UPI00114CFE2B|nr:DUF1565 domain-containing protein [Desertifilum tharense]MBD2313313.1 DUF1565 domain-containing protein [Desertifilum sp. FACHB-1129]MBD2324226.1 DUF1565 domain-containing protein [Desertifilum sp. FACHB-866]MBD2334240.1 DUF1565 domain-containing protein [Desertifilum sp. FACHB-868]MDA0211961.1 DUF1565 domain-containing protein [Cyanobacteria bacterium FC1]
MSVRQPQTQDLNQSESLSSGFMYRLLGCTLILSASLLPGMAVQANPGNSSTNASIVAQAERTQLYVNPASGSDASGRGNTQAPFKTLTHALKVAKADTVIQLAPGTYSTETGEVFPIVMKSGVTIVGNPSTKGEGIVIRGGDRYLSPTFAGQNVTVLGANASAIAGVTITNPNPRGYGLWIESTSPIVADNTFAGNSHDGVSVNGTAAPIVRNNHFRDNGANGITVFGSSRPEVLDNLFENTGFGINISQRSVPTISGNRILRNRDGIVVQASALPILRNNTIEGNERYGLVAIAQSQPNLGTASQAGGNVFRNNGELDIHAKASSQTIPVFGNQFNASRTSGRLDLDGMTNLVTPEPLIASNRPSPGLIPRPAASEPPTNSGGGSAANFPVPTNITPSPAPAATPPVGGNSRLTLPPQTRAVTPVNNPLPNNSAIPIQVPTPSGSGTQAGSVSAQVPVLGPLPVPNGNAPIGNAGNLGTVRIQATPGAQSPNNPPPPPTRGSAMGLSYRVVVDATTTAEQNRVRSLVPGAFRTTSNGRTVMQVGAFSDRIKADELLQSLNSRGVRARLEEY